MTKSDRDLGMDRSITRRDFLNGMSITVSGAMVVPAVADAKTAFRRGAQPAAAEFYPPALTGMRGSASPGRSTRLTRCETGSLGHRRRYPRSVRRRITMGSRTQALRPDRYRQLRCRRRVPDQAAFDQAHRAVDELMKRQVAWWNRV